MHIDQSKRIDREETLCWFSGSRGRVKRREPANNTSGDGGEDNKSDVRSALSILQLCHYSKYEKHDAMD